MNTSPSYITLTPEQYGMAHVLIDRGLVHVSTYNPQTGEPASTFRWKEREHEEGFQLENLDPPQWLRELRQVITAVIAKGLTPEALNSLIITGRPIIVTDRSMAAIHPVLEETEGFCDPDYGIFLCSGSPFANEAGSITCNPLVLAQLQEHEGIHEVDVTILKNSPGAPLPSQMTELRTMMRQLAGYFFPPQAPPPEVSAMLNHADQAISSLSKEHAECFKEAFTKSCRLFEAALAHKYMAGSTFPTERIEQFERDQEWSVLAQICLKVHNLNRTDLAALAASHSKEYNRTLNSVRTFIEPDDHNPANHEWMYTLCLRCLDVMSSYYNGLGKLYFDGNGTITEPLARLPELKSIYGSEIIEVILGREYPNLYDKHIKPAASKLMQMYGQAYIPTVPNGSSELRVPLTTPSLSLSQQNVAQGTLAREQGQPVQAGITLR